MILNAVSNCSTRLRCDKKTFRLIEPPTQALTVIFAINPMKILYDSQIFRLQAYGGISRYFVNLAQRVACEEQVVISASLYVNSYLAKMATNLVKGVKVARRPSRGGGILDLAGSAFDRIVIARTNPDIVHETYYSKESSVPPSIPTVLTVYDMIHERLASKVSFAEDITQRKRMAISRASHIICISESTRRDLLELYELDSKKVSVVPLGYDLLSTGLRTSEDTPVLSQPSPYVLYVGERAAYKNFKAFLRAFAGSAWLCENFRIICFGGGALQADEIELLSELSIKPHQIKLVGGGDDVLAEYYQNAAILVYPSLYEGFGIPPLEAMALGCPVVCSNTSSIPEIVGDAGEYFDPENIDSIRAALETVLQSSEKRAKLIQKGFKKCTEYSWDRCANKTLEIYRGLVK